MDPQVQALLDMMAAQSANAPKMWEVPLAEARAGFATGFAMFNAGAPEMASITDQQIPTPGGEMGVKTFVPKGQGPFPLLVYIHGGGFVIGNPDSHLRLCAELAEGAKVLVVSLDYRLAPEFPAPAALEDCIAGIRWAVENAPALGGNAAKFAIGGDSAGGNLTAASCQRLRDTGGPGPAFQLLMYGAFDFDMSKPSIAKNGEGFVLDRASMDWFVDQYTPDPALRNDPCVSPGLGDVTGMPPALLQVGTLDPLLDDSFRYANKLALAGVPIDLKVYPDMPHGFMQMSAVLDTAKRGVADACAALRVALHG